MKPYSEFLDSKRTELQNAVQLDQVDLADHLFDYQRHIVEWALKRGRCAVFADTGLGKTIIFLEWARHIPGRVLILAPLAVGPQIAAEAAKYGQDAEYCRDGSSTCNIVITNYENAHKFTASDFAGVVLDESSILKSYNSKRRLELTEQWSETQFRLCATATPAPNDLIEIANHSVFLGLKTFNEMRALYFVLDNVLLTSWRLKGHAVEDFWQWVSTWAIACQKPSDIGDYDDSHHELPPLNYTEHIISTDYIEDGGLFPMPAIGLHAQRTAKRETLTQRCQEAADHINSIGGQWVVWCNLNDESALLTNLIDGAVEVRGSHTNDYKERSMSQFSSGEVQILVTKPSICGFGMNWQHCHQVGFVGLSHSFEQMYQAIRRCWRYGQESPVSVEMFVADIEGSILANIRRKEKEHTKMIAEMVKHFRPYLDVLDGTSSHGEDVAEGQGWKMYMGDCIKVMETMEGESMDLSVFSPPFPAMYAYTDLKEDMGNSDSMAQLNEHYAYTAKELFRLMKPGRNVCMHMMQIPTTITRDGFTGRRDWRGPLIGIMERAGFIYYSEVTIDKDPQVRAIRSKDRGLLFKSLATDASVMQPCMADYLLVFRKPGANAVPIKAGISAKYNPGGGGWITDKEWIEWAHPVWYDIRESDVLHVREARDEKDERHLAPLQLGVIERCVKMWSNPGDTVFSPFGGIGSEGYQSLQLDRRYVGIELKSSYWRVACRNLSKAVIGSETMELFSAATEAVHV